MRYFEIATQLSRFFFAQDLRLVTRLTPPAPPARCVCLIFRFSQLEPDFACMSAPCQSFQDRIAFHNQFHADVIAFFRKHRSDVHRQ
jgi:hypothetical protein